jgi:hypothetical protein
LKKKRQKVHKSLKKEGKRRKIEKKVTKNVQNCTPDTKISFNVKMGGLVGLRREKGERKNNKFLFFGNTKDTEDTKKEN